jgi:hypothetical protein
MQHYSSGASRDDTEGKLDYEAFISPFVLERYAKYLHKHGAATGREGDNWQLGIPEERYMKSLIRHVMELWLIHRGREEHITENEVQDVVCAVIFNAMGYLFERMGVRNGGEATLYRIEDTPDEKGVEPICGSSNYSDYK